jgi:hypothetical protein
MQSLPRYDSWKLDDGQASTPAEVKCPRCGRTVYEYDLRQPSTSRTYPTEEMAYWLYDEICSDCRTQIEMEDEIA